MKDRAFIGGIIGTLTSATGTAIQTSEVLQIISLVITILGGILTIVMALMSWYKNAKKDGKITQEEIDEGAKILQEGLTQIQNQVDDKNKGGKK